MIGWLGGGLERGNSEILAFAPNLIQLISVIHHEVGLEMRLQNGYKERDKHL